MAYFTKPLLALLLVVSVVRASQTELVFVGSGNQNISAFRLDAATGSLTSIGDVAAVKAPSFIAIAPNKKFLYGITEGGKENSVVSAFQIDAESGHLTLLNSQPTGGSGPCHVTVDPKGSDVLVANYTSGSFSAFPINADGSIGAMTAFVQDSGTSVNPQRQEGPHAHCIVTDPDDHFVFGCDLGTDKVMIFKLDRDKGTLTANDPPSASVTAGFGPRHIAFSPDRRNAYVINEMASTVTAFTYDRRRGALTELANYTLLPDGFTGVNYAAEIAVDAKGKYVYGSNRGDNSIAIFSRDTKTGALTFIAREPTQGKFPRNFEIDPTGRFLLVANQDSNTIVVFRIDARTGRLEATGSKVSSDKPMCVRCVTVAK